MNSSALEKILSALGPWLRSLRFTLDSTAETIRHEFLLCPYLHSLAVTGLQLDSMRVFEEGYTNGAQMTSLSLGHVATTEASAPAFGVQVQQRPGRIVPAVDEFTRVMVRNTTLTHASGVAPELTMCHTQCFPGRTQSQQRQLRAFLGAVGICAAAMDAPVRRRV